VQDTWGAECHADLVRDEADVIVYKGTDARIDSYSAFFDNQKLHQTEMLGHLRQRGVTHLFVTGLALDVCVAFTALHAAEEGFVVTVVLDACAGVSDEGIAEKMAAFDKAGIHVANSTDVQAHFDKCAPPMPRAAPRVAVRSHRRVGCTCLWPRGARSAAAGGAHLSACAAAASGASSEQLSVGRCTLGRRRHAALTSCAVAARAYRSSIDEMTHAALRVRQAKSIVNEVAMENGHGAPRSS
jgi:hypothetical protein